MPPDNWWDDGDLSDISRYLLAEPEREFQPRLWLYFDSRSAPTLQLLCLLLPDYQLVPRATKAVEPGQPVFEKKISFDSETPFLSECQRIADLLSTATGKHWPLEAACHGSRLNSTSYSVTL